MPPPFPVAAVGNRRRRDASETSGGLEGVSAAPSGQIWHLPKGRRGWIREAPPRPQQTIVQIVAAALIRPAALERLVAGPGLGRALGAIGDRLVGLADGGTGSTNS